MTLPAVRQAGELVTHGPGRPLGLKVQPQLRLSLGYRDDSRNGAPVKTDHFRLRESDEFPEVRAKFFEVFGQEPKEIPIMLPTQFGEALEIRHRAWSGGGDDTGGSLRAIGQTNFALEGTLGGPDILNVFSNDAGGVEEVPISGIDDPKAKDLKLELAMTFTFGIPNVLGVGGVCAVSSRGAQSMDSLFQKLIDLYGMFGERVSYAVQPILFLRRASTRYFDKKAANGKGQWRTSAFFALDLRVPETLEDTFIRLRERDQLLLGPSAAPAAAELPSSGSAPTLGPDGDGAAGENEAAEAVDGEVVEETSPPAASAPTTRQRRRGSTEPETAAEATTGEHAPGQITLDGKPVPEQIAKITGVLNELTSSCSTVAEIIDEGDGVITSFEDWPSYARGYCEVVLGVECPPGEKIMSYLDAEQADRLFEHLDSLVIPF